MGHLLIMKKLFYFFWIQCSNLMKIGKTKSMNIQNGDLIHLLHHSKVKESGFLFNYFLIPFFLIRDNGLFFHALQNRKS